MSKRMAWIGRVGLLLACLMVSTGTASAEATALDHITLQLKWKNQFQFAGYYAAIQQGYYKAAGLDVTLIEAQPGLDPTAEVIAGHADFGVGNSDLLLYRYRGEPVVVLAVIFQHSPLVLLARAASGATDLQALHDKKIMWLPSEAAELEAYFKYEGVNPTTLNWRPHTLNIEDFISGNVDAMSAYSTDEPFILKQRNIDYYTFNPRSGGIDFYGDCLFTTEQQIRDHPARVRAFRAASLKGWEYALTHQEEIVDLILAKYNTQHKSREQLLFEAQQTAELMHPGLIEVGHINPGRWQHMAETYADFGMLPPDFSLDGFLYDPNPQPNYRWLYWTLGIVSAIAVVAIAWALPLWWLNLRLRDEVARQRALQLELRRAKDAAEASDAAKGHYLAVMSHEVRTPLSSIISLADLMQEEEITPDLRHLITLMQSTANDMHQLIDGILEYSKLEAGRLELEQTCVDIVPFLENLQTLFSGSAHEKRIAFNLELAPDLPPVITTDVRRLRRILSNILSNALKFTERGSVTLAVTVLPEPLANGSGGRRWRWKFVMRDTGTGIAPQQAAVLFNPYAQASAGISRRYGGTGLGLAISRKLARLLGGDLILAESAPGCGSTFVLEIVTQEPAEEPAPPVVAEMKST